MRIIITLIIISLSFSAHAQVLDSDEVSNFRNSYFISFDSDTIYGDVEYARSFLSNRLKKIYFIDMDGYRYVLKAKESNGFMMNGKSYISKIVDEMYYFMRPAVIGAPALYVLEKNANHKEHNSMAMIRSEEKETKIIESYLETQGKMRKIYPRRFKKQAPQLFSAFPDVVDMIVSDEFTFADIEEIVILCNYNSSGEQKKSDNSYLRMKL